VFSDSDRTLRSRIGAHAKWARVSDRTAATAPGRLAATTGLDTKLAAAYGIDPTHPDYVVRLTHARSAYFARLALKSAQARRRSVRS